MTFQPGDVIRDADNYLGLFRHNNSELGVFMTVRASDTGADIPRRAKPPLTLVASARPACLDEPSLVEEARKLDELLDRLQANPYQDYGDVGVGIEGASHFVKRLIALKKEEGSRQ